MALSITDKKVLNDQQWERLQAFLETRHWGERNSIMLRIAMYTGARQCEVLAITPADLDSGRRSVTIYGAKNSNDRSIVLGTKFFNELLHYVQTNAIQSNQRLFPITTRQFQRIWDEYTPDRNKTAHSLRHTLACKIYKSERDILVVKADLGHKQINNTMSYLDYVENRTGNAARMRRALKTKLDD